MDKERGSLGDRLSRYELEPRPEVLAGLKEKLAQQQKPKRRPPVFWIWISALLIGSGVGIAYFQFQKNQGVAVQPGSRAVEEKAYSSPVQASRPSILEESTSTESTSGKLPSTYGSEQSSPKAEAEKKLSTSKQPAQEKSDRLVIAANEEEVNMPSGKNHESNKADNGLVEVTGTLRGQNRNKPNKITRAVESGIGSKAIDRSQELISTADPEKKAGYSTKQSSSESRTAQDKTRQEPSSLSKTEIGPPSVVSGKVADGESESGNSDDGTLPVVGLARNDISFLSPKMADLHLARFSEPWVQQVALNPVKEAEEEPARKERKWRMEGRFSSLYSALREINIQQIQHGDRSRWLDKGGNFPNRMSMELGAGFLYPVSERLEIHLDAGLGFNREELYLTNSLSSGDSMTAVLSGNQIILSPVQQVRQERLRADRFYGMAGLGFNWNPSIGFPSLRFGLGYMLPLYQQFERELNNQTMQPSGARSMGSVYAWMGLNRTISLGKQTLFVEPQIRYFNQPLIWFKEGTRMRPFQVGLSLGWKW